MPDKLPDYRVLQRDAENMRKAAGALRSAGDGSAADRMAALAKSNDDMARSVEELGRSEARHIAEHGTNIGGDWSADANEGFAFRTYMRTGEARAALVAGTGANGGYIVPEALHAPLIEKSRKVNPILGLATTFELELGNSSIKLPYKATHGVVANATETGARSEQTEPTFASATLTAYDYYSDQRASQLEIDSVKDFESLMLGWLYADIYETAGNDFAIGDGITKAAGLFAATGTYTTKLSGSAGALVNTNFATLFTGLHPRYRSNAAWLMNSATLSTCLNMTSPGSSLTPLVTWDASGMPTIMGRPVYETQSAPDIGAANYPVAFGDIAQAYAIAMHRAPMVLTDPYTQVPLVRYYALARLGGQPWDKEACLLLKSNNA